VHEGRAIGQLPHDQTATLRQLEAVDALRGVGLILHAGDIGNLEIIENHCKGLRGAGK